MMSNASDRHEVSDARIAVVDVVGHETPDGEVRMYAQADPSHQRGVWAHQAIVQVGLEEQIIALADHDAFEVPGLYESAQRIASIRVDTHAREADDVVDSIELVGEMIREDADLGDPEDETEVVQ